MSGAVTAAVLLSAVLHATWSAIAFTFGHQRAGFAVFFLVAAVAGAAVAPWVASPTTAALPYLLLSVAVHVLYTLALMRGNRLSEFSQLYPISRGLSPVLITAFVLIGLAPGAGSMSVTDTVGIFIVMAGIGTSAASGMRHAHFGPGPITAAASISLLIATYTVLDGLGVRLVDDPLSYIAWLALLQGSATALLLGGRKGLRGELRRHPRLLWVGALGGLLSVVSYSLTIWAQAHGPLAAVAAVRESSIVFAALIGVVFLKEHASSARVIASVVIVAGIGVLRW